MHRALNRKASTIVLAFAGLVAATTASAQSKSSTGFGVGYNDIGVVVGLGSIGGASASFGGRFEHAIQTLPNMGNGVLGIEAGFDYYSWSGGAGAGAYSWKYIPVGVTANYHFNINEPTFDPFVGLGLGYQIITCSAPGQPNYCSNSALYFIGRLGARYFFTPSMALYGDVGAGGATVNLGLSFKLGG